MSCINDSKKNIWTNEIELFAYISLLINKTYLNFFQFFLLIELSATVYTGWRQIYFIYPSIIFICIFSLSYLLRF